MSPLCPRVPVCLLGTPDKDRHQKEQSWHEVSDPGHNQNTGLLGSGPACALPVLSCCPQPPSLHTAEDTVFPPRLSKTFSYFLCPPSISQRMRLSRPPWLDF